MALYDRIRAPNRGLSNSSAFATKATGLVMEDPTKGGSQKEMWLHATIKGPLRGIRSNPSTWKSRKTRAKAWANPLPNRYTRVPRSGRPRASSTQRAASATCSSRSEEHTSELQSPYDLVCRLLLEK